MEPVVEDEGEEEQPGTSLTNTNLSVAVKQLKDERYRLFHSLNVKELNFEKLLFFVSCGIFWKKKLKEKIEKHESNKDYFCTENTFLFQMKNIDLLSRNLKTDLK